MDEDEIRWMREALEWQSWDSAPKDAREILVQAKDKVGHISHHVIHWASDLSGEEQPPFQGWFIATNGRGFAEFHLTPIRWRLIYNRKC